MPLFSDLLLHDVGTGDKTDAYDGYNTPSLIGVFDRPQLLHDGRAKSLEEMLKGPHNPATFAGKDELTDKERADLVSYLKSL